MLNIAIGLSSRLVFIDKIIEKNDNNVLIFDENNYSDFLSECYSSTLFSNNSTLLLKNAQKIKNLEKFIAKTSNLDFSNRQIIIDYETNKENTLLLNLINNLNISNFYCIDEKENRNFLLKYIEKKLKTDRENAEKIFEITNDNYYFLKNEINKLQCFFIDSPFSFEEAKEIISKNSNFFIFNFVEDILMKKEIKFPIKEEMALFSTLIKDLEIIYILKLLNISINNYNNFKNQISKIELLNSYSPYYVYTKQKYKNNFSIEKIEFLLEYAFETEFNIKSGKIPLKEAIELFILKIISD